jgi:flagellar motor protein MotB
VDSNRSAGRPEGRKGREEKMRSLRVLSGAISIAVPLVLVGCVPYQQYEGLKGDYTRLKSANDDLSVKYQKAIQDLMRLKNLEQSNDAYRTKAANLESLNKDLLAKLEGFKNVSPIEQQKFPEGLTQDPSTGNLIGADDFLFNPGEATLKSPKSKAILDKVLEIIRAESPGDIIHISGHTDRQPLKVTVKRWGTNQRLGFERAYTAFSYFKEKGIPEDRMVIHSYSFGDPRDSGDSKEALAKNRRVEFSRSTPRAKA